MEKNQLVETPSPVMFTNSSDELTRSNSDVSSLTTDDSKHIFQRTENASPDNSTEWTNEKHNLYLNRLEASFVKQLHQSMGFPAWCFNDNKNARNVPIKQPANVVSEQFTVIQDGRKQMMNFGKGTVVSSKDDVKSPRINHFKRSSRIFSTGSIDHQECCWIHQEENSFVNVGAEGSGQNFLDNDGEDDSRSQTKKLKMAVADDLSDDNQIVPSGKLHAKDISAE